MFGYAWRSISAVMTAFYLLLSVGSCAVQTPEEPARAPVYELALGQSSVSVLQPDPAVGRALQLATEEYALSLGASISFSVQTVTGDDYRSALRSRLMAGEAVDLFHLGGADDVNRLHPWLQDMSELPWLYDAVPGTLEAVTADGVVYGVPYNYEGIAFVINRSIFDAAGIELAAIHDFESFSQAFYDLRDAIDAGDLVESFPELTAVADIAVQDSGYLGGQVAELLLADSFSSPVAAATGVPALLEAAGAGELLTLLARVSPQRTGWSEFSGVSEHRMLEGGLAAERVAAALYSTDAHHRIYSENPDMQGKLALLPVYLPERETGAVFAGPAAWWAIRAGADDAVRDLAGNFLTWLYQTEEGGRVLRDDLGVLSAYGDDSRTNIRLQQDLLRAQAEGLTLPRLAPQAPYGWGSDVFAAELQAYFTEYSKTWEELTEACKEGWREHLE